jgi:proteasome lid subunit RPN8/RPN11
LILRLKRHHAEFLKQEAKKVHPVEACAMLFGKLFQNEAVVRKVKVTPNKLKSTERFEIDAEMVASAITEAEKECLDFIGLFHSHPAPAIPSLIDLKYMKLWGDALWLILSSIDDKLAAYQLNNSTVEEVSINME